MPGPAKAGSTQGRGLVLLAALLFLSQALPSGASVEEEKRLLLQFKATLARGNSILSTWRANSTPCGWQGIACNTDGDVELIRLPEAGLAGPIPQPDGWALPPAVTTLELRGNDIRGPIPPGWRLPDGLETLDLSFNPLTGSLSSEWELPARLQILLLNNCNLTGPLPSGWRLPAQLRLLMAQGNALSGTIPPELTALDNLQAMDLSSNLLSGTIPATFAFNWSLSPTALVLSSNNFSGPVPSWPDATGVDLFIGPAGSNDGLCASGQMPTAPRYLNRTAAGSTLVRSLPPCDPQISQQPPDQGGGSGASAPLGAVVGTVAGVAALGSAAAAAWLVRRRRRQKRIGQLADGHAQLSTAESDVALPDDWGASSSGGGKAETAVVESGAPQPWAGTQGARNPSMAAQPANDMSWALGTPKQQARPPGGANSSSIALEAAWPQLLSGGSHAGRGVNNARGFAASNPRLLDRLDQLEREPPPWFISPSRVMLEQGGDGGLVLLGRGSYGRIYRGWLHPPDQQDATAVAGSFRSSGEATAGSPGSSGRSGNDIVAARTGSSLGSSASSTVQMLDRQHAAAASATAAGSAGDGGDRDGIAAGTSGKNGSAGSTAGHGRMPGTGIAPPRSGSSAASAGSAGAAGDISSSTLGGSLGSSASAGGPHAVAIKVMDVCNLSTFLHEAGIMQRLQGSPHVVLPLGACVVDQQLALVMELVEGGDLRAAMLRDPLALRWHRHGKRVAVDIASGLTFLHARNITHRDLKSKNVLLTQDLRAKVADVGGAAVHSATFLSAGSSNFGGTLQWAAPELLLAAPCTQKIDIFSLGVILWEIVTQQMPHRGSVRPPPPSEDCPPGLTQLISDCLQLDPNRRPTAQQALERLQQLASD